MIRFGTRLRKLSGLLAVLALLLAAASSTDGVHWRLGVIALKASGKLPELRWGELASMVRPGSGFWLAPLLDSPNPYAVIHSPYDSDAAVRTGRALFRWRCAQCHGPGGTGGTAPALFGRDLAHGSSDWALFQTIRYGVKSTAMTPHDLPQADLWKLVTYIQSLETTHGGSPLSDASGGHSLQLRFEDLRKATTAAADWPTYYGSYNGYRFSSLADINLRNVRELQARWLYQLQTKTGRIQTTPIALDGRLILTTPEGGVIALDGRTGVELWRHSRTLPDGLSICCVTSNRGVAVLDGTVYVATLDAHLLALDGRNGAVLWDKVVADYRRGYTSTGAPLAVKGMVITGIAGGEYGSSGFITAFDARSGKVLWSFHTIPGPGEKGNETWAGDSWRNGGVSTWMTGTYDADLDLIYWGTGNAAPDFDASQRPGDNLYSDSVVALHADSGQLAWYFQFSPGDDHDWDAVQTPVLADVTDGSRTRRLLLAANRNGFLYALDRTNGKFLWAKAFVKQNWAVGIDAGGRPIKRLEAATSPRGTLVYPGSTGATNWWPPTFDPQAQLLIVPALERPGIFFKTTNGEKHEGGKVLGGSSSATMGSHYTAVRALDPQSGELRWEYRSANRYDAAELSGLLSTAGKLVFTSDRSKLVALDVTDGRELWSFEAGGVIYAAPATYRAGSEQFIVFAAGDVIIGAALPPKVPAANPLPEKRTASR